jgi:RNA polymerase sigma factor (sigma-70 family)
MIDIVQILPKRINLLPKNYDNKDFKSVNEYIKLAKRSIIKFAPRYVNSTLVYKMLNSDDVVSNIATDIMIAQWKFNGKGSQEGYLRLCAIYSVQDYFRRYKYNEKNDHLSLNDDTESILFKKPKGVLLNRYCPEKILIEKEERESLINLIKIVLTEIEAECIILYYFDYYNGAEIGRLKHVSREYIRQVLKSAKHKLMEYLDEVN